MYQDQQLHPANEDCLEKVTIITDNSLHSLVFIKEKKKYLLTHLNVYTCLCFFHVASFFFLLFFYNDELFNDKEYRLAGINKVISGSQITSQFIFFPFFLFSCE